jgi:glycosyltransferase involved in cell wall biosynthesis
VSVIIPTLGRTEWLVRAVKSVLGQSYAPLEAIVVIDGPDPATANRLEQLTDARVKVLPLAKNAGGAEARNLGVQMALGEWVAFLDDDDVWMPGKLEQQMKVAVALPVPYPVVSSRVLARSPEKERILPRRLYSADEDVSEYLFCRQNLAYGDGMLQTSTLLTKRDLLLEAPFAKELKRHHDWDWILRIGRRFDVSVVMLPDALTIMRMEGPGESISRSSDWEFSLAWARENRLRMSRRAYSFFVMTECVSRARKCGEGWSVLLRLLWESIWAGQPGVMQAMLFLSFCFVPEKMRKDLRDRRLRAAMESGVLP